MSRIIYLKAAFKSLEKFDIKVRSKIIEAIEKNTPRRYKETKR